ncbi:MAG: glycosyltransferase, partial [Bacteroidia bacterium]
AVVLSPRGMKPIYQGELILEAYERLLNEGRKEKFIMLSAGYAISKAAREHARNLSIRFPNFHYEAGVIPRERVLQLWSLVDAFISAPIYDGYSNALAEGRYAGAVPLVNAIPGNIEVVEHDTHGIIVDPFNANNLAVDLRHSLNNLDALKARFAPVNRSWIEANSMMDVNIQRFIKLADLMIS